MATVQDLAALGEKMGLKGEQLQTFMKEQQALARDEREKERAEKEKERELERQRLALQREQEENKTRVELEKEANRLKIELEKEANRKLELELKKGNTDEEEEEEPEEEVVLPNRVKGPKMTAFDEKDDIDSYLKGDGQRGDENEAV
jgi:hypothetical protein